MPTQILRAQVSNHEFVKIIGSSAALLRKSEGTQPGTRLGEVCRNRWYDMYVCWGNV